MTPDSRPPTYQQHLHQLRESERLRIEAALVRPNTITVNTFRGLLGISSCDNARRVTHVLLGRADTLQHAEDIIQHLDLADLEHLAERILERQQQLLRETTIPAPGDPTL